MNRLHQAKNERRSKKPMRSTLFALAGKAVLAGFLIQSASADIQFEDVTDVSGLSSAPTSTATIHGLGISWIDINKDNFPDIITTNGPSQSPYLFMNNGDGTFTNRADLLPTLPLLEYVGVIFADYDNDGDDDVFMQVTNEQFALFGDNEPDGPTDLLLKNLFVENGSVLPAAGSPLFEDVSAAAGIQNVKDWSIDAPDARYTATRSMTGGWIDFNKDGCIDLYTDQMVLQEAGNEANAGVLFENNCDGTFSDVSTENGIATTDPELLRPALAFFGGHLDNDFWPDMYVVNVHEPSPHHHDLVYLNNRTQGGFTLMDVPGFGDDSGSGMGIDVADINLDGFWDIYISDVFDTLNDAEPFGNTLYLGQGNSTWTDNVAPDAGVSGNFSWGVNFFDADLDGYEDLFVATVVDLPKFLYHNNGDGTFTDVAAGVFAEESNMRGSAVADYDRDGDLDIATVSHNGQLELFRNNSTDTGNWLQLKLVGEGANSTAINTLVKVSAGGKRYMRQVKGGSSAHSQDDVVVSFGLGSARRARNINISWSDGTLQRISSLDVNTFYTIVQGEAPTITSLSRVAP